MKKTDVIYSATTFSPTTSPKFINIKDNSDSHL